MTTHQTNPHHYTDLNDDFDEAHPNAHFTFEERGSEEEEKSNTRHRTSASGNEAPNSGSSTQDNTNSSSESQNQSQRKELSSVFSVFYGFLLVSFMVSYVPGFLVVIGFATQGLGFDKFSFFVSGWFFVSFVIAFLGLCTKDLGKIEKSLTMIKIYFPLLGVARLGELFEAIALEQRYGTRRGSPVSDILSQAVGGFIIVYLLAFLPTRKVRNTWKTVIQEEEKRKEQARDADPIEKLDSLKFTIYKYALLISFCWEAKILIPGVYDDFADFPKFWGKMMSDTSYLVMQIYSYPLFPLSIYTTFLAFEGLRRKNLEKILTSIKLMKISLIVRLIFSSLSIIIGYYEGTLKERFGVYRQMAGVDLEMENDGMLFFFGMSVLITVLQNYVCIYFTSQVRDILKAHQRSRHTL